MAEPHDINGEHAQTAAAIELDAGVEHIGDVYAEALWNAAEKAGEAQNIEAQNIEAQNILEEFDSLIDDVLTAFPALETILASGLVSHDEKVKLIDRVFGSQGSSLMVNFLKVASRHGRLDCLRAIHRQIHVLDDKRRGRVPVTLTTAARLTGQQSDVIAEAFRRKLGGEPVVTQLTDPDLIGGAVVRVGDTVYDGSIANQLEIIRKQMIDRSVHEIQTRRDRFRNSAGN